MQHVSPIFKNSFRVVLVPFPLPPEAVLLYFLYRRLGIMKDEVRVFYDWRPETSVAQGILSDDVFKLSGISIEAQFEYLVSQMPEPQVRVLRRILYFLQRKGYSPLPNTNRKKKEVFSASLEAKRAGVFLRNVKPFIQIEASAPRLLIGARNFSDFFKRCALFWADPKELLEKLAYSFARCLDEGINPFVEPLPLMPLVACAQAVRIHPNHAGRLFTTRPKFATKDSTYPEAEEIFAFQERPVLGLMKQHLGFIIVGDPGVGKSTITPSLATEVLVHILTLTSHQEWKDLDLTVGYINLDLGTPASPAVIEGRGQDREYLGSMKADWTTDKAFEALEIFQEAKRHYNIVFADMPGRITPMTRIIASAADGGIVVYKHSIEIAPWYEFLAEMGVPKLAAIRTSTGERTTESLMRSHHGATVFGSVIGVDRTARSRDPFIKYLAPVVLFEQAPNLIENRQRQIEARLRKLRH